MNRVPFLAVVLLTVFAGACGGHSPSEPVGPDRVSVVSLEPANGSPLAPGSIVTFSARLDYELQSENSGAILLVIQDQNSALLTVGPQARAATTRGRGSATLAGQVEVPATGVSQVRVFFAMVPPDVSATQFLSASPVQPDAIYPVRP